MTSSSRKSVLVLYILVYWWETIAKIKGKVSRTLKHFQFHKLSKWTQVRPNAATLLLCQINCMSCVAVIPVTSQCWKSGTWHVMRSEEESSRGFMWHAWPSRTKMWKLCHRFPTSYLNATASLCLFFMDEQIISPPSKWCILAAARTFLKFGIVLGIFKFSFECEVSCLNP